MSYGRKTFGKSPIGSEAASGDASAAGGVGTGTGSGTGGTASGQQNVVASGGTGTGTGSGAGGDPSVGGNATAAGGTGTGTGSGSGGAATASGSFITDVIVNNTGTVLASTPMLWTWYQGAIGATPTSTTHGSGTSNTSGRLTATGLPSGSGFLLFCTTDYVGVGYQSGTVS